MGLVSEHDARIGANLAQLRGGTSQTALAAAMKARGWKWTQPTVAAVEKGERALKLAEAEDLVAILNLTDLEELTTRPLEAIWWARLNALDVATGGLELAATEFLQARWNLAVAADRVEESGIDVDAEEGGETEGWLRRSVNEVVSKAVTRRWPAEDEAVGKWVSLLLSTDYADYVERSKVAVPILDALANGLRKAGEEEPSGRFEGIEGEIDRIFPGFDQPDEKVSLKGERVDGTAADSAK